MKGRAWNLFFQLNEAYLPQFVAPSVTGILYKFLVCPLEAGMGVNPIPKDTLSHQLTNPMSLLLQSPFFLSHEVSFPGWWGWQCPSSYPKDGSIWTLSSKEPDMHSTQTLSGLEEWGLFLTLTFWPLKWVHVKGFLSVNIYASSKGLPWCFR